MEKAIIYPFEWLDGVGLWIDDEGFGAVILAGIGLRPCIMGYCKLSRTESSGARS